MSRASADHTAVDDPPPLPQHTIHGDGDVTVYLLHGAYGSGAYFDDTVHRLAAAGYRVIVWDAPGYAGTPPPAESSIPYFAARFTDLLDATAGTTNVVLGHSMGALIAPLACGDDPRVNGIVLSSASAGFASRPPEDQRRYLAERLDPIEQGGATIAEYAGPLIAKMMGPEASGPRVDRVREVILSMDTSTLADSIRAIAAYDGRPALGTIEVPTLLLAGAVDTACPVAGMRRIHELVSTSEIREFEGVGHYGFAERPDDWESALLDFLGRHFPAAPAGATTAAAEPS